MNFNFTVFITILAALMLIAMIAAMVYYLIEKGEPTVLGITASFAGLLLLAVTYAAVPRLMEPVREKDSYVPIDVTLAVGSSRSDPHYAVSFMEGDRRVTALEPYRVFVTDGPERISRCECRWWIFTMERYVYYANADRGEKPAQQAEVCR